jgi:hypothetical protein
MTFNNRNTTADRGTAITIISLAAIALSIVGMSMGAGAAVFSDPVETTNTTVTAADGNVTTTIYADGTVTNSTPFDVRVVFESSGSELKNTTVSLNEGNVTDVVANGTDGITDGQEVTVTVTANDSHDESYTVDVIGGSGGGGGGLLGGSGSSSIVVVLVIGLVAYMVTKDD